MSQGRGGAGVCSGLPADGSRLGWFGSCGAHSPPASHSARTGCSHALWASISFADPPPFVELLSEGQWPRSSRPFHSSCPSSLVTPVGGSWKTRGAASVQPRGPRLSYRAGASLFRLETAGLPGQGAGSHCPGPETPVLGRLVASRPLVSCQGALTAQLCSRLLPARSPSPAPPSGPFPGDMSVGLSPGQSCSQGPGVPLWWVCKQSPGGMGRGLEQEQGLVWASGGG